MKPMRFTLMLALAGLSLTTAPARAGELPSYTLVAKDGRLQPQVLEVPQGTRFKILIRNEGKDAIEFESLSLKKEKVLGPGAQSFVVIAPLRPGSYEFLDEFHAGTGRGRIVVK